MDKTAETRIKTKSILRTSSLYTSQMQVTFDEETIEKHNKLRGSKMIIDEPKTPFHYFDEEGNEIPPPKESKRRSINLVELNQKFEKQKSELGIEDSDEEEEKEVDEKRKKFLEKRRSHYSNEFCGVNPLLKKVEQEDQEGKGQGDK